MDLLFYVLVLLTTVFSLLVGAMVIGFALRYQRGNRVDRSNPSSHDIRLELTWSIIPLVLGLGIFVWGAKLFAEVKRPPANAKEVYVIGKRWMWHLQHTNGIRENNELHIPIGEPVKLTMISQDVIHDFFVPAFRIHQDVIPGKYTTTWFQPTRVGKYYLFCSQYCGTNHSQMIGWIYVMSRPDYEAWLNSGGQGATSQRSLAQEGADLYQQQACGTCHGAVNTTRGPSLVGIYGTKRALSNGTYAVADDDYLRRALVNPDAEVSKGWPSLMPNYSNLTEEQILALVAYMKELGANPNGLAASPAASPAGSSASAQNGASGSAASNASGGGQAGTSASAPIGASGKPAAQRDLPTTSRDNTSVQGTK